MACRHQAHSRHGASQKAYDCAEHAVSYPPKTPPHFLHYCCSSVYASRRCHECLKSMPFNGKREQSWSASLLEDLHSVVSLIPRMPRTAWYTRINPPLLNSIPGTLCVRVHQPLCPPYWGMYIYCLFIPRRSSLLCASRARRPHVFRPRNGIITCQRVASNRTRNCRLH